MTITLLSPRPRPRPRRRPRRKYPVYSSMVRMNDDGYPVNEPEPTEPPNMLTLPRAASRYIHENDPALRAALVWYHMQRIQG
jgi:hypothetical protein